jgi:hypothetical protein
MSAILAWLARLSQQAGEVYAAVEAEFQGRTAGNVLHLEGPFLSEARELCFRAKAETAVFSNHVGAHWLGRIDEIQRLHEQTLEKAVRCWEDRGYEDRRPMLLALISEEADKIGLAHGELRAFAGRPAKEKEGDSALTAATIISMGDKVYKIGESAPVAVTDAEDAVLQAFVQTEAMDERTLARRAGNDGARVLRGLRQKYDGAFASAIHCPKKKGAGGYRVQISKEHHG